MPKQDYEEQKQNDQQSVNTQTWQDSTTSKDESKDKGKDKDKNAGQNVQKQAVSETIPQLTADEQKAQDEKRNSPEFEQGLKEILPQGNAPKTDDQKDPGNLNVMIQQWQKDTPKVGEDEKNDTGLPDKLKASVETMSGISMDDVKVHYNSTKPKEQNALAYTKGSDIFVGPNEEKHLAHELWHVVQQKQGRVTPTVQKKGVGVNDDSALEKEADVMGDKALKNKETETDSKEQAVVGANKKGVIQKKEPRSKNPYNPQTGITSHHIIPHELLEKILDKFEPEDDDAVDERPGILKDFLPGFGDLTLSNFVAQVAVGVEYENSSPNKVTELPAEIADKKFGAFSEEEKGKTKFSVEDAGKVSFEEFNALYTKLLNGEAVTHDKGDGSDPVEVSGLRDLGESFYEWQSGNMFYGPDRIEPGAKDGFDFDASRIYGENHVKQLKVIYDKLRSLEGKDDVNSKAEMKQALKDLSALTKGVVVPRTDLSIWIPIDSAGKKTIHDKLLPTRNATSKEGASIHKDVLLEAITKYSTGNKAHDLLAYMGRTAPHTADGASSPDDLFEAKKNKLMLKDVPSSNTTLSAPIKRDDVQKEMNFLLKKLYGL